MTFSEYLNSLKNKTVAVIGIGVSNRPLIEALLKAGISVVACDRKDRAGLGAYAQQLEAMGARLQLGENYLQDLYQDVIFRTPGMRPDVPALLTAAEKGSVITSEMEIFFEVCPCPIIAVTGSDGKTTTTTIIAELLRHAGQTVHLGGNIGHPLLVEADTMKPAEDGSDDIVLRFYESKKAASTAKISLMLGDCKAYLCDMLENVKEEIAVENGVMILDFNAFEIKTVRVVRA